MIKAEACCFTQTPAHQVKELILTDLADGCLMLYLRIILTYINIRVGIRARFGIEQQRITDHFRLGAFRSAGNSHQSPES